VSCLHRDTRDKKSAPPVTRFPVRASFETHGLLPQPRTAPFVPSPEAAGSLPSLRAFDENVLLYGCFESYTVALGWQLASTGMHSPVAVNLTGHKTLLNEPLMYHQTLQQSISAPSELAVSWQRHLLRRLRIDHYQQWNGKTRFTKLKYGQGSRLT
jgi:hypothetical protein